MEEFSLQAISTLVSHDKPFLYEPRGFSSIEEHDAAIIANWNSVVDKNDTVYVLGDLMLNDNENGKECIAQLNGTIHVMLGNHCTAARERIYVEELDNIVEVNYATIIKYNKYRFYLSHYPTLTANYDDGKYLAQHLISLCGHSHVKDRFADWDKGLIYHCELDAHDCKPILIDDIILDLREKWKNDIQAI